MGAIYDDLPDHEGYASWRDEPTTNATPASARSTLRPYVAACSCGWTGGNHPPTEPGYEAALDEWDRRHAGALLAEAVPAEVTRLLRDAEQAVTRLIHERPLAGLKALRTLATWADGTVAELKAASPAGTRTQPRPNTARRPPGRTRRH